MRLIDADAFDRDLCNKKFTAALNEAADAGTAFEDKEMYYSTQSFRDVMKYRPTIDAVPLDKLCEWLGKFGCPCDIDDFMCDMLGVERCLGVFKSNAFCWRYLLTKMMEETNATDTE